MGAGRFLILSFSILAFSFASDEDGIYNVGVGIGDITGPPAGIVLNGYVNPITNAAGIHTRQFARAFVVESQAGGILAYVTCDMGMMDHSIKTQVVKKLQEKHGARFTEKNILISATHTHSGVSGFMTYFAYLVIESYGFNPITFWAAVDGITEAIEQATSSLSRGKLYWNRGELLGGNGNRQESAYLANPESERDAYSYSVDKDMTLLKLVKLGEDGEEEEPIGAFTWWPVHPISFNGGVNPLVSSDNKGAAALLFDHEMNPGALPGKGKFISGFGSSNLGDVSPRHEESKPEVQWDFYPDIARTILLGEKQFKKALELFNDPTTLTQITGPIRSAHQWINTTSITVEYNGETLGLCKAALGLSYVGLEPDFPGWEDIRDLIKEPSPEMVECQAPKLVALAAGEMNEPWPWAPSTVSLQLLQLGGFDIVGTPGEYTTMAGRRIRNAVANVAGHEVVIAGLSNNYINYVATPEEYDVQKYEGGATIYGRNTVPVTQVLFEGLARALENGDEIPSGEEPPSFLELVREDIDPWADPLPINGLPFGAVAGDAYDSYSAGESVKVLFNAGSPRNSAMRGGSFLLVEKEVADGVWKIIRTDADIDTTFWWDLPNRRAEIVWHTSKDEEPGYFRIRHFGFYRSAEDGPLTSYSGTSKRFQVRVPLPQSD